MRDYISNHTQLSFILFWIREYRVVSLCMISFMLFWGWTAFQFVNLHYKDMSDFVIAFYISIVAGGVWCVKFWTTTHATTTTKIPSIEE